MGIFDAITESMSSAAQAVVDAFLWVLRAIAGQAESLLNLLMGPELLEKFDEIATSFHNAWETIVVKFRAVNVILPLKEAFAIILVMWGVRAVIVIIRWALKFIPTLSS